MKNLTVSNRQDLFPRRSFLRSVCRAAALCAVLSVCLSACSLPVRDPSDTEAVSAGGDTGAAPENTGSSHPEAEESRDTGEVPDPDDRSVYYADSTEELVRLSGDPSLFADGAVPTVVVGYAVDPEETDVTFRKPLHLIFRGWFSGKIRVVTRETAAISVRGGSDGLYMDAPLCDVSWNEADSDAELRLNVRTLNGKAPSYGGTGSAVPDSMTLKRQNGEMWEDTGFTVSGNRITVLVPYFMNDSMAEKADLVFLSEGGACTWEGANEDGTVDLYGSAVLCVTDAEGETRRYLLCAERFRYDLPVLDIRTDGAAPITSKTEYVPGSVSLDGTVLRAMLKGRGNSSWTTFPKKAYGIKLAEKASLIPGTAPAKNWSLVSAYCDKALIRNKLAEELCRQMERLEFVPGQMLADVWLNGEYLGVYTLSEKIEARSGRLNLGPEGEDQPESELDCGFLIEIGWDYSGRNIYNWDYFDIRYALRLYVKEPEIDAFYNAQWQYICKYVRSTENAIEAGSGCEDYADLDNFADWFLMLELTNNTECAFYRSCYMYKRAGGRLRLGPLWDFDMAFGNYREENQQYNVWTSAEPMHLKDRTSWMTFLIQNEAFMSKVRARWAEKRDTLYQTAMRTIDEQYALVSRSQVKNFEKWDILGRWVGNTGMNDAEYNTFDKQIEYLRSFLEKRFAWMDSQLL